MTVVLDIEDPLPVRDIRMQKFRVHGLVADAWKLVRMMQISGHFLFEYHAENSFMLSMLRFGYSMTHLTLVMIQYVFIIAHLMQHTDDANDLSANTISMLFFAHCVTKFIYVALKNKKFYRTLGAWNAINSHPLFAENHARHHATSVMKMNKVIRTITTGTALTVVGWTLITFVGESVETIKDPMNANDTIEVELPRLMIASYYPWDVHQSFYYLLTFVLQFYFLTATLFQCNFSDVIFCTWLIHTCEQLLHLKEIMKPLMELSASLDTPIPYTSKLFRVDSASSDAPLLSNSDALDMNLRGYNDYNSDYNRQQAGPISTLNGGFVGPNGLTKKQELLVRSAIKYWVERHKHVVRFVAMISDTYGGALLMHMLTSTVTLTLLAYQATRIESFDVYAVCVCGYLFYTFAQVFLFCYHGNRLIEESSSVLEAAYSCHWYDGSEEAKTFIQIVCQQCQKAMIVSGAKFFTVSLDLFASVLGAVVTYFMVLVQLK